MSGDAGHASAQLIGVEPYSVDAVSIAQGAGQISEQIELPETIR